MKATISPGPLTTYNGISCRMWEGVTENGARFKLFAIGLAIPESEDSSEFDAALQETREPSELREALSLRQII